MTSRPRRSTLSAIHATAVVGALALSVAAMSSACSDLGGTVTNVCASQEIFEQSVSPFVERRCGTLDCHGGIARPMRIFGRLGLRHPDEDNVSGGAATTALERAANYTSVCGVDAEKMNESVQNLGNTAEKLLIVTKARGLEKHKGGKVVNENDPGDLCILSWLRKNKGRRPGCRRSVAPARAAVALRSAISLRLTP